MDLNFNANRDKNLFAHELHADGTAAESLLWYHVLKAKKMGGYQFHRRYLINDSTVDFICLKLSLIIEITGDLSREQLLAKHKRDEDLQQLGYFILNIADSEVVNDLENVKVEIRDAIELLRENLNLRH
ncbi:MAG: DUF559 domain-containing protein [Mariniphaga sp.]